jgi:hypothetical protein
MGVFGKVRNSKATGGGNYFEPDFDWAVLINAVKHIETRDEKDAFIVECKVLETDCEKVRPGQERSFYCDMTKDAAPGNVRHFVEVATEQMTGEPLGTVPCESCDGKGVVGKKETECPDCDGEGNVSEIDEAGILEIVGNDQPMAGLIIGLTTYNKPTRAGNPFTRHKWTLIDPKGLKKYQEIAKKLGLTYLGAPAEEKKKAANE